jgi:selenocysteine lyase/cysteine desulfurase
LFAYSQLDFCRCQGGKFGGFLGVGYLYCHPERSEGPYVLGRHWQAIKVFTASTDKNI